MFGDPYFDPRKPKSESTDYHEFNIHPKYKEGIDTALEAVKKSKYYNNISEIFLFGSCAKQTTKAGSDIDLLIIYDDENTYRDARCDIGGLISDSFERIEFDVVVYTPNMYNNGTTLFTKFVKQYALSIHKRSDN